MKSDSHRDEVHLTPPISAQPDRQPANISGPRHPSDEGHRNREAEGVEMHYHLPEKSADEIMNEAHRSQAERNEHHSRRK
jgi:hypothetical protein